MAFEKALKTLEYNKIIGLLSKFARTEGAKECALGLTPSADIDTVRFLNSQTDDAKKYIQIKGMPSFGNIKKTDDCVDRAIKGATLSIRELLDVANLLQTSRTLTEYSKGDMVLDNGLDEIFDRLYFNRSFETRIKNAFPSEDTVADTASTALSDIRRKIRNANNKIRDTLQKYINSPVYSKYLQDNLITIRNGRYVIPVKVEYKNEIKGLVHDTSSSGSTLFIEPLPVVDANNELSELTSKEKNEIEKILSDMSADVASIGEVLKLNYANITELAFIFAKGEFSFNMNACCPDITEERIFSLNKARHPLIDKEKAVPITVSLGGEFDTLVITGPNTGGKTVSLKTLGLCALMVQSGLHIPADESSRVCVFSDVYADIGDEQSIEQSLSTFSSHMVNIIDITSKVDENSLCLFDELGAGTDPVEGAALAMSVLEYVRKKKALCAATTHYAELKAYALETEGVSNGSCEFDVNTLKPTYRLIIGTPGKSNAFEISSKLGLSTDIVSRARELVSKENKSFESIIGKLDKSRIEMEENRLETEKMKSEFEIYRAEAEKRIAQAEKNAENELKKARETAARILGSARNTSDFIMEQLDKAKKAKEKENANKIEEEAKAAIRNKLKLMENVLDPVIEKKITENYKLPRPLKVGDEVIIAGINTRGKITKITGDKYEIQSGALKTKCEESKLVLIEKSESVEKRAQKQKSITLKAYRNDFKATLDIRGNTGDDGMFMVDKYLDDAILCCVKTVTILHGKGTGALRKAIWDYLKTDKRVKSYRAGKFGEGDYGVTVVELK